MTDPDLIALLQRLAARVDAEGAPARRDLAFARLDRRQRRQRLLVAVAMTLVVILAGALAVVASNSADRSTEPPVTSDLTAAQLAGFRWRDLPSAPIPLSADASLVWTGTRLFVWGGDSSDMLAVTTAQAIGHTPERGALYDPATRSWTVTAPAPITPRADAITAWTGTKVLVWGGTLRTSTATTTFEDGAMYDPSTNAWSKMSRSDGPVTPSTAAVGGGRPSLVSQNGVWTGDALIALTGPFPVSATASRVRAWAYRPGTGRWRALPSYAATRAAARLEAIDAVPAGNGADVWLSWDDAFTSDTLPNGDTESSGSGATQQLLELSPETGWSSIALSGPFRAITSPTPAGHSVVGVQVPNLCGSCTSLFTGVGPTLGVATSSAGIQPGAPWRTWPTGPESEGGAQVWTGRVLVRLNVSATIGSGTSPDNVLQPGDLAALDLATRHWTPLPPVPLTSGNAEPVWVGDRLIVWGDVRTCRHRSSTCATPGEPVGGVELRAGVIEPTVGDRTEPRVRCAQRRGCVRPCEPVA